MVSLAGATAGSPSLEMYVNSTQLLSCAVNDTVGVPETYVTAVTTPLETAVTSTTKLLVPTAPPKLAPETVIVSPTA